MRRHRVAVPLAAIVCAVAATLPGVAPPLRAAAATAPGQWHLTAPMATDHAAGTVLMPRMCVDHTAPPAFPCGRVLVTGGMHFEGKPQNTVELYDEAAEQWASAAPMNQAREGHTATLLSDGRVLVAGGSAQGSVLASVEIFDPLLGRWARTAPMAVARHGHSATLLPSGKVLVAGGDRGAFSGVVATSEVFDPAGGANASGSWSDVRPMSAYRSAHTATAVTGGSVLVAGGATAGEATPTAELYDAATGAWRSVPPMAVRRYAHAATTLPDGDVLVAGGVENGAVSAGPVEQGRAATASVERFDVGTGTWVDEAPLTVARAFHAVTSLGDGRLLAAGGQSTIDGQLQSTKSSEIFAPGPAGQGSSWQATGASESTHTGLQSGHVSALLPSGRVLMAGPGRVAEVFDPAATAPVVVPQILKLSTQAGRSGGNTQVRIAGMHLDQVTDVRFGDAAAQFSTETVGSQVELVAISPPHAPATVDVAVSTAEGRRSGTNASSRFTYVDGTWRFTQLLNQERSHHSATLLGDGSVLVAGGFGKGNDTEALGPLADSERFAAAGAGGQGTWTTTPGRLAAAREQHTATLLADGRVLVVGGQGANGTILASAEIFDPATGSWSAAGSLARPRIGHTATLLSPESGLIMVAGGRTSPALPTDPSVLDAVELFDPRADGGRGRWSAAQRMQQERSSHTATLLPDGTVVVAGGALTPGGSATASAERYDPTTGAWSPARSMTVRRRSHLAVRLTDGKVLVAGGDEDAFVSAELFDPASGTWSSTASMSRTRNGGQFATLADGDVMFVDQVSEVYDPQSHTWGWELPPNQGRRGHSTTVLPSGGILIAGGLDPARANTNPLTPKTAELYRSGQTVSSVPLVTAMAPTLGSTLGNTVVTLTGRALFPVSRVRFGERDGVVRSQSDTRIEVLAPAQPQGVVNVTVTTAGGTSVPFRFAYGSGAWRLGPRIEGCGEGCEGRFAHTATRLTDGSVLVAGGAREWWIRPFVEPRDDTALASTERYSPANQSWSAAAALNEPRTLHTATLLHKPGCHSATPPPGYPCWKVFVVGGQDRRTVAMASAEIYDPAVNNARGKWQRTASLGVPRYSHTATLLANGDVLVSGGGTADEADRALTVATAEIYHPESETWSVAGPMATARQEHTATVLADTRVLVAGGLTTGGAGEVGALASAELYDPATRLWSAAASMDIRRSLHTATLLGGSRCDRSPAPKACGKVLVVGGAAGGTSPLAAAELYDAVAGSWSPAPAMPTGHAGHTATLLDDGQVLVAGSGPRYPDVIAGPSAAVDIFDPSVGTWKPSSPMPQPRGGHAAILVDDGSVVVLGGYVKNPLDQPEALAAEALAAEAEIYIPGPALTSVSPARGPNSGGTMVFIAGSGLASVTEVRFGEASAPIISHDSPRRLTVRAPAAAIPGPVTISAVNAGGSSATLEPDPFAPAFTYVSPPAEVDGLTARALSDSAVALSFAAPDDGTTLRPATEYVVKQSESPIRTDGDFEAARALCDGVCRFSTPAVDVVLTVGQLAPDTQYFYAVQALSALAEPGPYKTVSVRTLPSSGACPAPPGGLKADQVGYPAGYSLVGLPAGTLVGASSPLYGWFDQGAGGSYLIEPGVAAGRGYWGWFRCPRVVDINVGGNVPTISAPLGAYHASMVGNPSATSSSSVTGHDFAARWDPSANGGAGGYLISGYREAQSLGVGEGIWAFSFVQSEIRIAATP